MKHSDLKKKKSTHQAAGSNAKNKKAKPVSSEIKIIPLKQEVPEKLRDPVPNTLNPQEDTTKNLSQPEDRGEDLITERDPFIQQPERETQIPPEIIQQRAYHLYEQRGLRDGDDLADWFEAERQLRGKIYGEIEKRSDDKNNKK